MVDLKAPKLPNGALGAPNGAQKCPLADGVNVGLIGNPVLTVSEGKGIRGIPTSTPGGVLGPANGTAFKWMLEWA